MQAVDKTSIQCIRCHGDLYMGHMSNDETGQLICVPDGKPLISTHFRKVQWIFWNPKTNYSTNYFARNIAVKNIQELFCLIDLAGNRDTRI